MEGKRNIPYSAEDIRKYLDGRLSDPEMQAMEKAALDDPFLADAIEGYEESRRHPDSLNPNLADLLKLSKRIRQRKTENRDGGVHYKLEGRGFCIIRYRACCVHVHFFVNKKSKELSVTNTENKKEVPVPPNKSAGKSIAEPEQNTATRSGSDSSGSGEISVTPDKEKTKLNKKTNPAEEEENLDEKIPQV